MSELTDQQKELVAIGASIGCNCIPCIAFHVGKARQAGLTDKQIEAAVALAEGVRAIPASMVVNTARAHLDTEPVQDEQTKEKPGSTKCGCKDTADKPPVKDSGSSKCGC